MRFFFKLLAFFTRYVLRPFLPKDLDVHTAQILFAEQVAAILYRANGGLPASKVVERAKDESIAAFYGGSKLEVGPFVEFITELMKRFVIRGYSVVGGGGPGAAMEDVPRCLKEQRSILGGTSPSRVFQVPSGLPDEKWNQLGDKECVTRKQFRNEIREGLIAIIANIGCVVFPGNWGTILELAVEIMANYIAPPRLDNSRCARPIIVVDTSLGEDGFWGWLNKGHMKMVEWGLSKPSFLKGGREYVLDLHLYRVTANEAGAFAAMEVFDYFIQQHSLLKDGWEKKRAVLGEKGDGMKPVTFPNRFKNRDSETLRKLR